MVRSEITNHMKKSILNARLRSILNLLQNISIGAVTFNNIFELFPDEYTIWHENQYACRLLVWGTLFIFSNPYLPYFWPYCQKSISPLMEFLPYCQKCIFTFFNICQTNSPIDIKIVISLHCAGVVIHVFFKFLLAIFLAIYPKCYFLRDV